MMKLEYSVLLLVANPNNPKEFGPKSVRLTVTEPRSVKFNLPAPAPPLCDPIEPVLLTPYTSNVTLVTTALPAPAPELGDPVWLLSLAVKIPPRRITSLVDTVPLLPNNSKSALLVVICQCGIWWSQPPSPSKEFAADFLLRLDTEPMNDLSSVSRQRRNLLMNMSGLAIWNVVKNGSHGSNAASTSHALAVSHRFGR